MSEKKGSGKHKNVITKMPEKKRDMTPVEAMGATDIEAARLWNTYPNELKEIWLHNAFCPNCISASFKPGYNLRMDKFGVVIEGYCDQCGGRIARCCD